MKGLEFLQYQNVTANRKPGRSPRGWGKIPNGPRPDPISRIFFIFFTQFSLQQHNSLIINILVASQVK
nr:MAG TPA: hypothetical protein [Caudoviricetes sp.]